MQSGPPRTPQARLYGRAPLRNTQENRAPGTVPVPGSSATGRVVRWLAAVILLLAAPAAAQPEASPASPETLRERLAQVWETRDLAGYLALWHFEGPEAREAESAFAQAHFGAEETSISLQAARTASGRVSIVARVVSITEPRGRVEEWVLSLEAREQGWAVVERRGAGEIDGLVHLSVDPRGFRAEGLTLRLEDFEMQLQSGTLFLPPTSVGPTLLVFVGEGTVLFSPKPAAEREELRKFCGQPELRQRVRTAVFRLHPADLPRILGEAVLTPDDDAARRLPAAQEAFREHGARMFVLDGGLPRAPWWLLPGLGDATVVFETSKRGTLTFAVSHGEFEGVSLFDRARRLQICLYPSEGNNIDYNEDSARGVDVLHHQLRVAFEPTRYQLSGQDTLKLRLLAPTSTLRLKLAEELRVHAITSREAGNHLFFRVRGQDSLVVSMGALGRTVGDIELTVRYSGKLHPSPIEQEAQGRGLVVENDDPIAIPEVLIYSNRQFWYPTATGDDYALADLHFDVPSGYTALAGGTRTQARVERDRTLVEYRQDRPGKYVTVAVGRLVRVGERNTPDMAIEAFAVPRTRSGANEALDRTEEILRFYTQEFGPPPYASLRLALIEGVAPGGHSPPGMVLVARRPLLLRGRLREDPANFGDVPDFFLAHELAHQWWGHGVAGQNYHERWISEGFAQYASALWVRNSQGERAFRDLMRRMAEWALRRHGEGPISLGYRLGHLKGDPQIFRAVVYDKGALVLHMLRGIVGADAFRSALTQLQAEHRFLKIGTTALRAALESASGKSLSAYFDAWVLGTELPTLTVARRHEPGGPPHRTRVEIKAQGLPGPVPLELTLAHSLGEETLRVVLDPAGGHWMVETPGRPGKLVVNSDGGLLARVEGK
jgi:hypothetical protein